MAERKVQELIQELIDTIGADRLPSRFIVDADIVANLIMISRRIARERSLSKGLQVKFNEVMIEFVEDMASVYRSDEIIIHDALAMFAEQEKWKEALDKFYGVEE